MTKEEIISKLSELENAVGMWSFALNSLSAADYVIGCHYNPDSGMFDVYVNNERGRHRIRLSTADETQALEKVLKIAEFIRESGG